MLHHVFSFYNYKIGAYNLPLFRLEDPDQFKEAVLRQAINSKPVELAALVECELYYLGDFDDHSGSLKLLEKPVSLVDLRTLSPTSSHPVPADAPVQEGAATRES